MEDKDQQITLLKAKIASLEKDLAMLEKNFSIMRSNEQRIYKRLDLLDKRNRELSNSLIHLAKVVNSMRKN